MASMDSSQSQESSASAFFKRYERLRIADEEKNTLIEDLIKSCSRLEEAYEQEKLDLARERDFSRSAQLREREMHETLSYMRSMLERDPYVLVLLDGDGMIFEDDLLKRGEAGGKEAAHQLWNNIREDCENRGIAVSPRIMAKLYVNIRGLASTCYRAGIVETPKVVEDFFRGFTSGRLLFDTVDAGAGKEKSDSKVSEFFKMNIANCHCHQIYLGGSHDNGYARLLEEVASDALSRQRVTMLEGVPFERELQALLTIYPNFKIENLFRESKITIPSPTVSRAELLSVLPISMPTPPPATSMATPPVSSTAPAVAPPAASSWATLTASAPAEQPASPALETNGTSSKIERNRFGQRIDRTDFSRIDRAELNRIKKMKCCNSWHLLGQCPNPKCTHDHDRTLTKKELATLRYVAKMSPCQYETDCDQEDCLYGHKCPQSEPGKKDCYWKDDCRFAGWGHDIDQRAVKLHTV